MLVSTAICDLVYTIVSAIALKKWTYDRMHLLIQYCAVCITELSSYTYSELYGSALYYCTSIQEEHVI